MTNKEYGKLGSWYLAGNVTRRELVSSTIEATTEYGEVQLNQRGKPLQVNLLDVRYEIKWNLTDFNGKKFTHMIPLETVRRGMFIHFNHYTPFLQYHAGIENYQKGSRKIITDKLWKELCSCKPSDEIEDFEDDHEIELYHEHYIPEQVSTLEEAENLKSIAYTTDAYLPTPKDLYTHIGTQGNGAFLKL